MIRPLLIVLLGLSASMANAQQTSEPNTATLLAELPDGRHRVVDGAHHMIQMAQPDAVVAAILEVVGPVEHRQDF